MPVHAFVGEAADAPGISRRHALIRFRGREATIEGLDPSCEAVYWK